MRKLLKISAVVLAASHLIGAPALAERAPAITATAEKQARKYSDAELKKLTAQAEVLYKTKRAVELINLANDVLARDPKNATFLLYRGEGWGHRRRREQAIADFSASVAIAPSLRAYKDRAYLYKGTGEKEKALQDNLAAIKISPVASNYLNLAYQYYELLKFDESIAASQNTLATLNTEPFKSKEWLAVEANRMIGMNYLAKNQPTKALEFYNRAVENIPGYSDAAKKKNRPALIKLVKNYSGLFLLRGEAYEKSGKFKEAIAEYELTVDAFPTSFDFRRSLLRAYRKTNQNEKALALATDMLRQDDSPDLYYKRSEIYKKLGKPDLAKIDFDRARKIEYGVMGGIPSK